MNKLLHLFYNSILGEYYLLLVMWLEDRKLARARRNFSLTKSRATVIIKQELLVEGVKKIKRTINSQLTTRSKEEYEKTLREIEELGQLAIHYEDPKHIEIINNLKKAYVASGKDIKNDEDKALMIQRRINDYEILKRDKGIRQKLREARNKTREML